MAPLFSLCLITKNEQNNLRRCLQSAIKTVDEIIVVDTGSSDATISIAQEFGAKIQEFLWNGNFSDARNTALDLASGEWILIMDADEELTSESAAHLRELLKDETIDGYFIKILNYIGNDGWQECCPDLVFRLFRNKRNYRFHGAIHEQIADVILKENPQAKFKIAEEAVLLHYGYLTKEIEEKNKKKRNITILEQELLTSPDNKLLRYHYGVELYRAEKYIEAAEELIKAGQGLDPQTIYFPKLLRYIVLSYFDGKAFTEALKYVILGLQFYPDYVDLHYYGGLIHYEQAAYTKAFDFFNRALSMPRQPSYYAGFSGLCGFRTYYYLGQIAEKFCNKEEAMRYYLASLRDNPSFTIALEKITHLLDPRQYPEDTRESLEKICEFCTPQACFRMANILYSLSSFDLALAYFERGLQGTATHSPETLLWQAICLIQQRRNLEALTILDSFDPSHSLYPLSKLNELLCFWLEGNKKKSYTIASELFSLGLDKDTGAVISILQDRANTKVLPLDLGTQGMSLLLDIVGRIIDIGYIDKSDLLLARLSNECLNTHAEQIGRVYTKYGLFSKAAYYFKINLKEHPSNHELWFMLGEMCQKQGSGVEALSYYRQALTLNELEPKYYLRLTALYKELSDQIKNEAQQRFCGAAQLLPKEG